MRAFVNSYVQHRELDPELKRHYDTVRTNLEDVAQSVGDGFFHALKTLTIAFHNMDQDITNKILDTPLDELEWVGRDEHGTIFQKYLNLTSKMLDFCNELDSFVDSAGRCHRYITHEIQQLEEKDVDVDKNRSRFEGIVEKLRKLNTSEVVNGISVIGLLEKLKSLTDGHQDLLNDLEEHHKKYGENQLLIEEQKKSNRLLNKIAIVSMAVIAGVAIVATVGAAAFVTAAVVPTALLGIWVAAGSATAVSAGIIIWESHEGQKILSELEKQRKIIEEWTETLDPPTKNVATELDTIKHRIDNLANTIESLAKDAEFAATEKYSMSFATEEIKLHLAIFQQRVEELDIEAKNFEKHILEDREKVKEKMNNNNKIIK